MKFQQLKNDTIYSYMSIKNLFSSIHTAFAFPNRFDFIAYITKTELKNSNIFNIC